MSDVTHRTIDEIDAIEGFSRASASTKQQRVSASAHLESRLRWAIRHRRHAL